MNCLTMSLAEYKQSLEVALDYLAEVSARAGCFVGLGRNRWRNMVVWLGGWRSDVCLAVMYILPLKYFIDIIHLYIRS